MYETCQYTTLPGFARALLRLPSFPIVEDKLDCPKPGVALQERPPPLCRHLKLHEAFLYSTMLVESFNLLFPWLLLNVSFIEQTSSNNFEPRFSCLRSLG